VERVLFLTGHLAAPGLQRVLTGLGSLPFTWQVHDLGLQVAALMTADMIRRRLPTPLPPELAADRIVVPGRCRGDVEALSAHYGLPVERGPEEMKDLPRHFKRSAAPLDLSRHDTLIFAEIVDAPRLTVAEIVERARYLRREGADVIDIGGLPATPFPHLEDAVRALKAAGLRVSVDSLDTDELLRGGGAGADFLLSLKVDTLWVADELPHITPVLIARTPDDEQSLDEAIAGMQARGRRFLADAILDPIPFGFVESIARYQRLARRHPTVDILMGVGNLTELTEADTSGINALLFGMAAELGVKAVLATQVSTHCRRAVREAELARRIMFAAREQQTLPKGLHPGLMTTHVKLPFPDTPAEIAALAAEVRDPNFRVQVSEAGVHVYNRDGLQTVTDPFAAWPGLKLDHDASHAFYMGVELARAQIAWQLGKRHVQDRPLEWGVAAEVETDDEACAPVASTRPASRKEQEKS
jgi:dihydropteroate synthase-like protein